MLRWLQKALIEHRDISGINCWIHDIPEYGSEVKNDMVSKCIQPYKIRTLKESIWKMIEGEAGYDMTMD